MDVCKVKSLIREGKNYSVCRVQARKIMIFCCVLCSMMLSGCSKVKDQMVQFTKIVEDEDYKQYISFRDMGQLDNDGNYNDVDNSVLDSDLNVSGKGVHVSFAVNSCLDVQYYWDKGLTDLVDVDECYLKPGECIYVKKPICRSTYGRFYSFDEFRIYEYSQDQSEREEIFWMEKSDDLTIKVPKDYTGTEVTIEPVGRYESRQLLLEDYYIDSNGNKQEAGGKWVINGQESQNGDIEVQPAVSYMVDYIYDEDKYEFVDSQPQCINHKNGCVQFEKAEPDNENDKYAVRLRPLGRELPLKIILDDSVKDIDFYISAGRDICRECIKYDNGEKIGFRPEWLGGTERLVFDGQVRMGSEVMLQAENGTLLQDFSLKLDIVKTDTDGRDYKLIKYINTLPGDETIPIYKSEAEDSSAITYDEVRIAVSKVKTVFYEPKVIQNASIEVFFYEEHSSGSYLQKGDRLEPDETVRVTIVPKEDYYVAGSDVENGIYSNTMSYEKWSQESEEIINSHPVQKVRSITIEASDDYGTCIYKLDGEVVSGTIEIRNEHELVLEYTVTDPDYQIKGDGFVGGLINKMRPKTSETCKISLSEIPDGSTIKRSDYIQIEKRGN